MFDYLQQTWANWPFYFKAFNVAVAVGIASFLWLRAINTPWTRQYRR
jgi:hypothetical protein